MPKAFIEIDTKELEALAERFEEAESKLQDGIVDTLVYAAELYLRDLITNTPVDTGYLKQQWRKDNPNLDLRVKEVADGYQIELVNYTEYASWVEKGHWSYNQFGGPYGWVMGRFYVKNTEVDWDSGKLQNVVTRRINKWLRDMLGGG